MRKVNACILAALALLLSSPKLTQSGSSGSSLQPEFHTSDRCEACHNQIIAPSGQDVLDRHGLAREHHGEFGTRSLLAGRGAQGNCRSPGGKS